MVDDKVTQFPDRLERLATKIHRALNALEETRESFATRLFEAGDAFLEARQELKTDIDFGKWCNVCKFKANSNERAALMNMAKDKDKWKSIVINSVSSSIRLIYDNARGKSNAALPRQKISEETKTINAEAKKAKAEESLEAAKIRKERLKERFYETAQKAFEAEAKARRTADKHGFTFRSYEERMGSFIKSKVIFTEEEFKYLITNTHPDIFPQEFKEKMTRVFALISGKRKELTGK